MYVPLKIGVIFNSYTYSIFLGGITTFYSPEAPIISVSTSYFIPYPGWGSGFLSTISYVFVYLFFFTIFDYNNRLTKIINI